MPNGSECVEQKLLRERYYAALRSYWEVLTALEGVSNYTEFVEAYERAEGVRLLFVRARLDLEDHIREHGCLAPANHEAAGAC